MLKSFTTDNQYRKGAKLFYGWGTQLVKPVLPLTGAGSIMAGIDTYSNDVTQAALYASVGVMALFTHKILTSNFAKDLITKTKDTEWRSATYSKKHFKDKEWNKRFSTKGGPTYTTVNMYNHFVIKHNMIMDFMNFDSLVKVGMKVAVHVANTKDLFSRRFKEASKESGLWNKFNALFDNSKDNNYKRVSGVNVLDEISKLAPEVDGFVSIKDDGPANDLFELNNKIINRGHDKYLLNNSYFSFAMLYTEIEEALKNDDAKTIEKLSGKDGIGHFINTYRYNENENYKPLAEMAESLLQVMDNYVPGDRYHFALSNGTNPSLSIKENTLKTFDNLARKLKASNDIEIEIPVTISEEMVKQIKPSMSEKLSLNKLSTFYSNKDSIDPDIDTSLAFQKTDDAADKFAQKIENKFKQSNDYT